MEMNKTYLKGEKETTDMASVTWAWGTGAQCPLVQTVPTLQLLKNPFKKKSI